MPQGETRKATKARDEKRSKKPSAAWEALVGSSTSSEPNLAKRTEEILRLCSAVILIDSGPLVPAGALNDPHHRVHRVARLCNRGTAHAGHAPDDVPPAADPPPPRVSEAVDLAERGLLGDTSIDTPDR
jgi:hypothetical protein